MCRGGAINTGCHSVINLADFGIDGGIGCIADSDWVRSIIVPCHICESDPKYILWLPCKKVYSAVQLEDGMHGIIDGGIREDNGYKHRVMIKRAKVIGRTLLQEALIQKVVYESLCRGRFPLGAAKVYDIIGLKDNTVCFTMEPMMGQNLQLLIEKRIGFDLSKLIIEVLIHISAMLWHLMADIGMNHRDLKPSNIIIHECDEELDKIVSINDIKLTLRSRFDVSFIDFGFSCVGIEGGGLKAGSVYDEADPCPKDGRDMYMFLAFMYFYTHRKLPVDMDVLFSKWLNVDGCNMTGFLKSPANLRDKREVLDWIYKITGDPRVVRLKTTPEQIVRDLLSII
jgi:serine/threonine protein kinase